MTDAHPRIREVLDYLDESTRHLQAVVERVPHAWHQVRPDPDAWSVAEVVEHLAVLQERLGPRIGSWLSAAEAAGLPDEYDSSPVLPSTRVLRIVERRTRVKAPDFVRPAGAPVADALDRLLAARAHFCALILRYDGKALSTVTAPHFALGELSVYEWVAFIGAHERRHAAQIEEIVETLRRRQGDAGSDAPMTAPA